MVSLVVLFSQYNLLTNVQTHRRVSAVSSPNSCIIELCFQKHERRFLATFPRSFQQKYQESERPNLARFHNARNLSDFSNNGLLIWSSMQPKYSSYSTVFCNSLLFQYQRHVRSVCTAHSFFLHAIQCEAAGISVAVAFNFSERSFQCFQQKCPEGSSSDSNRFLLLIMTVSPQTRKTLVSSWV